MKRWVYVLIPLGFVVIATSLILLGRPTGGAVAPEAQQIDTSPLETSSSPEPVLEEVVDPDSDSAGVPTPSGPEYDDNQTVPGRNTELSDHDLLNGAFVAPISFQEDPYPKRAACGRFHNGVLRKRREP